MRYVMVAIVIVLSLDVAMGEHVMDRSFIADNHAAIRTPRENLVDKKEEAIQLCEAIDSLTNLMPDDAQLLAKHLTLADPRRVGGKLALPSETFPSVRKLIQLGPKGAQAVVDSIQYDHVNKHQLPINIAYVLRETVGVEAGIDMLERRVTAGSLEEAERNALVEAKKILTLQSERRDR